MTTYLIIEKANFEDINGVGDSNSHLNIPKRVSQEDDIGSSIQTLEVVWWMDGILILVEHVDGFTLEPFNQTLWNNSMQEVI